MNESARGERGGGVRIGDEVVVIGELGLLGWGAVVGVEGENMVQVQFRATPHKAAATEWAPRYMVRRLV